MQFWRRALWAAFSLLAPSVAPAEEHALRFAAGQRLTLPALELSGPHTVEFWMRARTPLTFEPVEVISWGGSAAILFSRAAIDYRLDLGGSRMQWVSAAGVEAGRWRHLAASFDGRRMRLYLDGRLINVRIAVGQVARHPEASTVIGSQGGPEEGGFAGEIDEVRFWNRARREEEIHADSLLKLEGGEAGLAGYWSLDEGSGQVALDRSPAARHGVLGATRFPEAQDPSWEESSSPVRRPDPEYRLLFDPPGPLSTRSGEEFSVRCVLRCPGGPLAMPLRAWSISVQHERSLQYLVEVSIRGSTAEPHLSRGFFHVESLDGPAGTGFIARAILDEDSPALPAAGDVAVAVATYRSLAPRGSDPVVTWIGYQEGLSGTAGPARNSFRVGDRQVFPLEGSLEVSIRHPLVALGFAQEEVLRVVADSEFEVDCLMKVAENAGEGAQSWSISVQHDPSVLEITDATTSGTVVERVKAETSVFQVTELVDNESGAGFLSAIILSIARPYSLPPNGEERIARARYRVREGVPPGTTRIAYRDGLRQSGEPVDNLVVFQAGASEPEKGVLSVRVVLETLFARGDLNGDHRVNMADAVGLLSWLFRQGLRPGCLDAADLNDDGRLDLADPVFLLAALFKGSRQPPAPYPLPGPDPTPDALLCEQPVE